VDQRVVWGPVAVGLALTGRWGRAVIMTAIGVLVIGFADDMLRPLLSRHGSVQLPTFVLLVAMFGGLATVGGWGLLLGPLLVRLAVEAVSIERDERLGRSQAAAPSPAPGPDA
jgi:predicted PurR-regulated permease PerM